MRENYNDINNDLLVKYMLGECTGFENDEVEAWISNSASNKKYFDDFKLIWDKSKELALTSDINTNDAWNRFTRRVKNGGGRNALVKQMNHGLPWMRIAATFLIIAASAIMFYTYQNSRTPETIVVATKTSILKDTLPDGSLVTLNKNSSISYPKKFKGHTRNVALQGEAFFNVTPDQDKPFIIQVNDVQVKVVGTSFNVRVANGRTEVVVETGVVQVIRNNKMVAVKPKEKAVVKKDDSIMMKEKVTDKFYDYYRSQQFVCDNTPLWKLVEVLNEAYDANIVIGKPSIRKLQINTTFYNQSLDQILDVVKETFKLTVKKEGEQIILE